MFFSLFVDYMKWHYSTALIHYVRILKTLWWYLTAYFDIPQLANTLFTPYFTITKTDKLSLWDKVIYGLRSSLSRCFGCMIRLCIIILGILALFTLTVTGIIGYGVWLVLPFVPSICLLIGLILLIVPLLSYL